MSRLVQFKRGTTAQNEVYGGLTGELTVDTDKQTLVLHDGSGGFSPMATEDNAQTLENKTLSLSSNTIPGLDGDGLEITSNQLGIDSTVVRTSGAQTIAGAKTLTDVLSVNNSSGITTDQTSFSLIDSSATTITFGSAATSLSMGDATGTTTINNDLSVVGNFTVGGQFTVSSEETLFVEDKNIVMADTAVPSDTTADGGGIIIKGSTDKSILWNLTGETFTASDNFNLASSKVYRIAGVDVLSSTTLGSGVVNSSLETVGTITTGTWNGDTIDVQYGGTGQTSYTDGQLLIGNSVGNTLEKGTLTGGTGLSVANGNGSITITNTDRGSSQFIFKNIADDQGVPQIVASANNDTLGIVAAGSAYVNFDSQGQVLTIGAEGEEYTAGDGLSLDAQNEFSVNDTVVRTSGNQTLAGTKTFDSTIVGDISGNAATASRLDPGAFINGVFFDGSENINLPSATLDNDLIPGDGISSTGPYNGSVERTFVNSDKGSEQPIFKNIQNDSGVDQFSASTNSDAVQFAADGDLTLEFDSNNNRVTYSLTVPEGNVYTAGDGLNLSGSEFSVDDTVVRTSGNQTISGTKTFGSAVELSTQATALTQAVRADREIATGDGLTGGGRLDDDLTIALDSSVVRDSGEQSIAGTKTFVNTIIANTADPGLITNEIASNAAAFSLVDANVTTINFGGGASEINIGSSTGQTNFNHDVNLATGSVYQIGNTDVLTSDTLGSGVVNSSLETVGIISTGTWQGDTIQEAYGGTGETTYTDGQLLIGNSSTSGLTKTTLTAGNNITIDNGNGSITINGAAYTAGNGITVSGNEFSVSAGDGLNQTSTGLEVDDTVVRTTGDPVIDGDARIFSLGVGTNASGLEGDIRATGSITAYYLSDQRLKENVVELPNAMESIDSIRGVSFDWTDEEVRRQGGEDDYFVRRHSVGVIAQEVEEILPEAVATRPDGYKAVKYEMLVPLLIQGMKEQQEQIKMLQEKVDNLCQRH